MGSNDTSDVLDRLLVKYLTVLDSWQSEVDAIRIMHHEIWKESRVHQVIKQHRAGSRVERQTRILPLGQRTDVDYKFEVVGVEVNSDVTSGGMYWKPSEASPAYGKIYVTQEHKSMLTKSKEYNPIFSENAFRWDEQENAFLLLPEVFKVNVVKISGFAYAHRDINAVVSPSLPGDGAMNEYDIVPCLKISQWPESTESWFQRGDSHAGILNSQWKKKIRSHPLYVVATGNPSSTDFQEEFRLSFSLIEVQTFRDIPAYARQLFGLAKYVFKKTLEPIDFFDSYHMKTLFLWILEETSEEELSSMKPLQFTRLVFMKMKRAVESSVVEHFYVENCNIFPFHKLAKNGIEKRAAYVCIFDEFDKKLMEIVEMLLKIDLKLPLDVNEEEQAFLKMLTYYEQEEQKQAFVHAYLVRLLSVTTFSLYENQEQDTVRSAVTRINEVFQRYTRLDPHIARIIPMVNATLEQLMGSTNGIEPIQHAGNVQDDDRVSVLVHQAFEAYSRKDRTKAAELAEKAAEFAEKRLPKSTTSTTTSGFGVSITSYHKQFQLDEPLKFVIRTLEEQSKNGKCPRFYVDPLFLAYHILIQTHLIDTSPTSTTSDDTPPPDNVAPMSTQSNALRPGDISTYIARMEDITEKLPDHVPYKGKLSYKFTSVYVLHGYKRSSIKQVLDGTLTIPQKYSLDYFQSSGMFATNFELR